MQIRNLAVNTQESYVQQVSLFARYFNRSPEQVKPIANGMVRRSPRTATRHDRDRGVSDGFPGVFENQVHGCSLCRGVCQENSVGTMPAESRPLHTWMRRSKFHPE
jgi:hypothetical protein